MDLTSPDRLDELPIEILREGVRFYETGQAHEADGEYDKAIDSYLKAMQTTAPDAVIWNDIAHCYLLLGKRTKCREALENALGLEPDNVDSLHNHALILIEDGEYEQAKKNIDQVLASDKTAATSWKLLGEIQYHLGKYDESMQALATSVGLAPNDGFAHRALGLTLAKLGKHECANRAFLVALEHAPRSYEILMDYGVFLLEQERYAESEEYLRKAIEEVGEYHNMPYVWLADLFIRKSKEKGLDQDTMGDYVHEAMTLLNKSREIVVNEGKTWFHQGEITLFFRKWEDGAKYFQASIDMGYDNPWAWGWLSACLGKLGREKEAEEAFQEFKRRGG